MTVVRYPPRLVQLARFRAARLLKVQTTTPDTITQLVRTIAWNAIERDSDAATWIACRVVNHLRTNHMLPGDLEGAEGKLAIEALIMCIDVDPKASYLDQRKAINVMTFSWRHAFWRNLYRSILDEIADCEAYPRGFEIRCPVVHEPDGDEEGRLT